MKSQRDESIEKSEFIKIIETCNKYIADAQPDTTIINALQSLKAVLAGPATTGTIDDGTKSVIAKAYKTCEKLIMDNKKLLDAIKPPFIRQEEYLSGMEQLVKHTSRENRKAFLGILKDTNKSNSAKLDEIQKLATKLCEEIPNKTGIKEFGYNMLGPKHELKVLEAIKNANFKSDFANSKIAFVQMRINIEEKKKNIEEVAPIKKNSSPN